MRDVLILIKATAVFSVIGQVKEVDTKVKEVDAKVTVIYDHVVNILISVTSMYANILIDESFQDSTCQVCLYIFSKV